MQECLETKRPGGERFAEIAAGRIPQECQAKGGEKMNQEELVGYLKQYGNSARTVVIHVEQNRMIEEVLVSKVYLISGLYDSRDRFVVYGSKTESKE